jgi:primosomal replication protein N
VFIDRLDLAAARALQFGRSLNPDELRAVHFVVDHQRADELAESWRQHGLANIGLEIVDCPDRRLTRSAMTAVAHALADGQTEVCVVLPDRRYGRFWRRILHDQTAEALARDISRLQHVTVTTVPFHLGEGEGGVGPTLNEFHTDGAGAAAPRTPAPAATRGGGNGDGAGVTATLGTSRVDIADVQWRQRVRVTGTVSALRVQPVSGTSTLECTLMDNTGGISVLFLGRRTIAGIEIGTKMTVEGMVVEHHRRLAIMNPVYEVHA